MYMFINIHFLQASQLIYEISGGDPKVIYVINKIHLSYDGQVLYYFLQNNPTRCMYYIGGNDIWIVI